MRFKKPESIYQAILQTVAYADIFEYPVTLPEIHRYLIGYETSIDKVDEALQNGLLRNHLLETQQGLFFLPGRDYLVEQRKRRTAYAEPLLRQAVRYGQWITHLPFVRMVVLTGALTSSNVEKGADLDYLIITMPGYLWLCRAFILLLTRLVAPFGAMICPNYLLTSNVLELAEKDMFTAQELSRMIPISGIEMYNAFRGLNRWADAYLPNASHAPHLRHLYEPAFKPLQAVGEFVLSLPFGPRLEQWEMNRKIARLSRQAADGAEIQFSADRCKGHFEQHGTRTLEVFASKVEAIRETRA